uniref:Uncharacterized protein n=1 Tax=Arundo donax TaxID=35708 RepID=A0A0A9CRS4_ARUDO
MVSAQMVAHRRMVNKLLPSMNLLMFKRKGKQAGINGQLIEDVVLNNLLAVIR